MPGFYAEALNPSLSVPGKAAEALDGETTVDSYDFACDVPGLFFG